MIQYQKYKMTRQYSCWLRLNVALTYYHYYNERLNLSAIVNTSCTQPHIFPILHFIHIFKIAECILVFFNLLCWLNYTKSGSFDISWFKRRVIGLGICNICWCKWLYTTHYDFKEKIKKTINHDLHYEWWVPNCTSRFDTNGVNHNVCDLLTFSSFPIEVNGFLYWISQLYNILHRIIAHGNYFLYMRCIKHLILWLNENLYEWI